MKLFHKALSAGQSCCTRILMTTGCLPTCGLTWL
ncbi:hypothetical protein H5410_063395 [Solanum commersonii]|uniref:Uncharacterized protein n=1 Tax=Solanum commersonii TaxID=4109 RepID=A0A9J5WDP9_SOLCO|nr:hypothetical protein H5410_063395 [Solanum commersonii]